MGRGLGGEAGDPAHEGPRTTRGAGRLGPAARTVPRGLPFRRAPGVPNGKKGTVLPKTQADVIVEAPGPWAARLGPARRDGHAFPPAAPPPERAFQALPSGFIGD